MTKIFKISIYLILISILSVIFLEIILNFFKETETDNVELHGSEYYEDIYQTDPYVPYVVQYIHPFYMFSLPWQDRHINSLPFQNIVGIDEDGFRKIENNNNNNILILLGGSTAFGHFARNDAGTMGNYLNDLIELQVVNRNAPSWNSHQELISVLKYKKLKDVRISVSMTLVNDVSNICFERINSETEEHLDFPESWEKLNYLVSDIRLRYVSKQTLRTTINWFKEFVIKKNFSNITRLFKYSDDDKNLNNFKKTQSTQSKIYLGNCNEDHINLIVNSFLENQIKINKLSEIYDFKHYTIIQPHFSLHKNANLEQLRNSNEITFRRLVINKILQNKYCKKNHCVDLSTFFDDFNVKLNMYSNTMRKNDPWFENGFFVDEYHFTDLGNKKIAEKINLIIN